MVDLKPPTTQHRLNKRSTRQSICIVRDWAVNRSSFFVRVFLSWTVVFFVVLLRRFSSDRIGSEGPLLHSKLPSSLSNPDWRLFCFVVLQSNKDYDRNARLILDSWGSQCDKVVFYGWKEDVVHIPHVTIVQKEERGSEEFTGKISHRVWKAVHETYGQDYDFFLKGTVETYMLMDNYFDYLRNMHPSVPLYFGKQLRSLDSPEETFVSGMAVTLSRAALQTLGRALVIGKPKNGKPRHKTPHVEGEPDIIYMECHWMHWFKRGVEDDAALSQCLGRLGIYPMDTRETSGRERFMIFHPHTMSGEEEVEEWYGKMSFNTILGPGCCSQKAVAFNFVNAKDFHKSMEYNNGIWRFEEK